MSRLLLKGTKMSYRIITDSSCNLPTNFIDENNIGILSHVFIINGIEHQNYVKGQTADYSMFYNKMREGEIVTTSLPSMESTIAMATEVFESGQDLIYIGFSSVLSGTYEAIHSAVAEVAAKFPERKAICVESLCASGGQSLMIVQAVRKMKSGASIEELEQWVIENRLHLAHWFTVDDLVYLFRGGRVSKTSAWAGTLLKIKPVLHVDDEGALVPVIKSRGRKKSLEELLAKVKDSGIIKKDEEFEVFIQHADCLDEAKVLADMVTQEIPQAKISIDWISPVIGAHAGPGTLAVFFTATQR